MKTFKVTGNIFRNVFKKKFNIFAISMIIVISMILGLICVLAFWNPEEKMEDLPIAIINLDEGTRGNDIIEQLQDDDNVNWKIYDNNIFAKGIENTDYFLGFLIPANFSESIESAKNGTPQKAEIVYYSNIRKNYILSQFSRSIKTSFEDAVSASITKEYSKQTFDTLYEIKEGINDASKGSSELSDGIGEMSDGINEFNVGTERLNSGISEINKNTKLFNTKMNNLKEGSDELHNGISTLNQKIGTLKKSVGKLSDGASTLSDNTNLLKLEVNKNLNAQSNTMDELLKGFKQILDSPYPSDVKIAQIKVVYSSLSLINDEIDNKSSQMTSSIEKLDEATNNLSNNMNTLNKNVGDLSDATGSLYSASKKLNNGTKKLNTASSSINSGTNKLAEGSNQLNNNLSSLTEGAKELNQGSVDLNNGLLDSGEELNEKLINSSSSMSEFISKPVEINSDIYGNVTNYGAGFAPLFMSLGLWIGSLMLFFIICPANWGKPKGSSLQLVFGNYFALSIFALLEGTLIAIGALFMGLEVTNVPNFILFTLLISIVFTSIMQCLHIVFGELISKALCVLAVIVQIASSSGTFPVELTDRFFEKLNPFLPFTYSIDGFREIISGGNMKILEANIISLLSFALISFLLSIFFIKKLKNNSKVFDFSS